jgi:ABC-type uncharacterized transport system involved in gliding motility auxiliary subunit
MTDLQASQETQPPIIPPQILLYVALFGFVIALAVAFTEPTFTIVGAAGLGVGVMSLLGWAILNPTALREFLTGRALRYGGASVFVTVLVLTALVMLYIAIRSLGLQVDLTETQSFSLTTESAQAIEVLGADPNLPEIKLMAFYGNTSAGRRDRDTVLFDQYVSASNGKISYEFINPERAPEIAQQYEVTRDGQIAVVRLGEDGVPDLENRENVAILSQDALTNAVLRVASTGDFRAYFLSVDGGLTLDRTDTTLTAGLVSIRDQLVDRYKWTVEQIGVLDILGGEIDLQDAAADGVVLLIPGGTEPLNDEALAVITDFLDAGGDALIFADAGLSEDGVSLATADNFTAYLNENYGASFSRDIMLDPTQTLRGSPLSIFTRTADETHPITASLTGLNVGFIFNIAHPLNLAEAAPENVTVTPVVSSGSNAYLKPMADVIADNQAQAETDPTGVFPLAVAAENAETGSRVLLVGSTSVLLDRYAQFADVANLSLLFNGIVWATRFDEFFTGIQQVQRPVLAQDSPINATSAQLSTINFLTVIVLPFGVLLLGLFVWWTGRERAQDDPALPGSAQPEG